MLFKLPATKSYLYYLFLYYTAYISYHFNKKFLLVHSIRLQFVCSDIKCGTKKDFPKTVPKFQRVETPLLYYLYALLISFLISSGVDVIFIKSDICNKGRESAK